MILICLFGVALPLGWLLLSSGWAMTRRGEGIVARLDAGHRFAALWLQWVVLPGVALLLVTLVWAQSDSSRAVNLAIIGALAGFVGAALYHVVMYTGYAAGWFPYNPIHPLGRLVNGYEADGVSVSRAGLVAVVLLGICLGAGYGILVGNYDVWYGLGLAAVLFLVGLLAPALAFGGGPHQVDRGVLPLGVHLIASLAFGLSVALIATTFATTRGLLVATLFAGS